MKLVRILFLYFTYAYLLASGAHANLLSEGETPDMLAFVSYKVLDIVKGEISFQDVKVQIYKKPSFYYRLERKDQKTRKLLSVEISAEWSTVMFSNEDRHYADLSVTQNVAGNPNSFYGRIEIKSFKDHSVVAAWPVIGENIFTKKMYTKDMTAFMSEGKKLHISETFELYNEILPITRKQQIVDGKGNILSEIYYVRL